MLYISFEAKNGILQVKEEESYEINKARKGSKKNNKVYIIDDV
jgi:hypothetical protein